MASPAPASASPAAPPAAEPPAPAPRAGPAAGGLWRAPAPAGGGGGGGGGEADPIAARFEAYAAAVASQVRMPLGQVLVSVLHGLQSAAGEDLFGEDLGVAVRAARLAREGRTEALREEVRAGLAGGGPRDALRARFAMAALVGQTQAMPSLAIARRVWARFEGSEADAFKLAQTFLHSSAAAYAAPAFETDLALTMTLPQLRERFRRARRLRPDLRYWDRLFELFHVLPDGVEGLPEGWVDEDNNASRAEIRAGRPWLPMLRPDGSVASVFRAD